MGPILRRVLLLVAVTLAALGGVLVTELPAASGQLTARAGSAGRVPGTADAAEPGVVVGSITLSRASVAASGLATAPVTVTAAARATDSEPMETLTLAFQGEDPTPPGVQRDLLVPLTRVSGTATDGVWRGIAHVGSVHDGTLRITTAYRDACWTCGAEPIPIPVNGPSLTVRGSHVPRISIKPTPNPIALSARSATLRATVTDSTTGRPYASPVTVWFDYESMCVEYGARYPHVTRGGVARLVLDTRRDKSMLLGLHCAFVYGPEDSAGDKVPLVVDGAWFDVTSTVTIRPAAHSVRVNRPLVIRGRIADASSLDFLNVKVQRLVGRTRWRTMVTADARQGRYTAKIRYGTRGRLTLRTVVDEQMRATSTPTVVRVR